MLATIPDMARPTKPATKTIRVHVDVARLIETCASAEGLPASDWVSEFLRPLLRDRLPRAVGELMDGQTKKKPVSPGR